MRISILIVFIISILLGACTTPIDTVLESNHPAIQKVMDSLEQHEVQILYTQIDTTEKGLIAFTDHAYQVKKKNYYCTLYLAR